MCIYNTYKFCIKKKNKLENIQAQGHPKPPNTIGVILGTVTWERQLFSGLWLPHPSWVPVMCFSGLGGKGGVPLKTLCCRNNAGKLFPGAQRLH